MPAVLIAIRGNTNMMGMVRAILIASWGEGDGVMMSARFDRYVPGAMLIAARRASAIATALFDYVHGAAWAYLAYL